MDTPPPKPAARRPPSRVPLSPTAAVLLAISFGLCGGYLDLFLMLFKKFYWDRRVDRSKREGFPLDRPGRPRGSVADPRRWWSPP